MASTASLLLLVAFFVHGHGEHALDDGALLLAGGHHRLRPGGQLRQLGRRAHDGGHVQGRRRHVLPGRRQQLLPPVLQRCARQESTAGQLVL
jgi:hypothetical protein